MGKVRTCIRWKTVSKRSVKGKRFQSKACAKYRSHK